MSVHLQIIVTYIKENIIYSLPRNPRASNKSSMLFVKKPLCTGGLFSAHKIFVERPAEPFLILVHNPKQPLHARNSFKTKIF